MKRHQVIAFINGDCKKLMKFEDVQKLTNNVEEYQHFEMNTFKTIIHYEPLFKIISSNYRKPDEYKFNERGDEILKLQNYIPETTIETLSYFDYVGEKIYGCIKQGDDYWNDDLSTSNSSDLYKLMTGLSNYLTINALPEFYEPTVIEVKKLKLLSEIGQKYDFEIKFYDGYFWQ